MVFTVLGCGDGNERCEEDDGELHIDVVPIDDVAFFFEVD